MHRKRNYEIRGQVYTEFQTQCTVGPWLKYPMPPPEDANLVSMTGNNYIDFISGTILQTGNCYVGNFYYVSLLFNDRFREFM